MNSMQKTVFAVAEGTINESLIRVGNAHLLFVSAITSALNIFETHALASNDTGSFETCLTEIDEGFTAAAKANNLSRRMQDEWTGYVRRLRESFAEVAKRGQDVDAPDTTTNAARRAAADQFTQVRDRARQVLEHEVEAIISAL